MKNYASCPTVEDGRFQADEAEEMADIKLQLLASKPSRILNSSSFFVFVCIVALSLISVSYLSHPSSSSTNSFYLTTTSLLKLSSNEVFKLSISVASPTYGTPDSLQFLPWDAIIEPHKAQVATVTSFTRDGAAVDLSDYSYSWSIEGVEYAGQSVNLLVKSTGVKTLSLKATPNAGGDSLSQVN
jgi:hypothetical protein